MFQMTFAIITPALIVGAFVERIRFGAVMAFSLIWLLVVYVPVTHWVWGGGWLAELRVMDYAGGIVVHVTAGVSALRSEEHTSELQSLMRISYAVFCLKKKKKSTSTHITTIV